MKSSYRLVVLAVIAGAGAILLLAFLRQQSELTELRQSYAKLAASRENPASLGMDSAKAQTIVTAGAKESNRTAPLRPSAAVAPGAANEVEPSEAIPKGKGPKPWQGMKVTVKEPERINRLILKDKSVKAVADGLVASMTFNQSSNTPLEQLAIVVRLPKTSDARILNLEPDNLPNYDHVQKRISENGKFAIFMGSIKDPTAVSLNLALSAPETADVRGTCGIEPFALTVDSTGATVQHYSEK